MFIERLYSNQTGLRLPDGWRIEILDCVGKRGSGHTPDQEYSEYWNGGIKWVSLADSSKLDKVYLYDTSKQISELGIQNSSAVLHPTGTVILSRDAGVGKSAILAESMAVSQHFIAWTCGSDLHNLYLYYWLQFMKPEFERQAVGSTIKTIGLGYFKKLQLVLPPLAEQRKIAAILGTWDEAIFAAERLIVALKERKRGLMQCLIGREARRSWQGMKLTDVAEVIISNVDKKSLENEIAVRLCNYTDVFYNDYIFEAIDFMKATASPREIEKFRLQVGDVLLTKDSETVPDIAQVAVVEEELPNVLCGYHLAILRPKQQLILGSFLRELLGVPEIHRQFEENANGVTRYGLTISAIKQVDIAIPSIAEQQKIVAILRVNDDQVKQIQRYSVLLRQQKRGLMQRLLTGQVRVGEASGKLHPQLAQVQASSAELPGS